MVNKGLKKNIVIISDSNKLSRLIAHTFADMEINVFLLIQGPLVNGKKSVDNKLKYKTIYFNSPNELSAIADNILNSKKIIDYLISCQIPEKTVGMGGPLLETSTEFWKMSKEKGINNLYEICRTFLRKMAEKGKGRFILIDSITGIIPIRGKATLSMISAGNYMISKSITVDAAKYGITANSIALGALEDDLDVINIPVDKKTLNHIPLKRVCRIDEILRTVVFVTLDAPDYLTGNTFILDGGFSCSYMRDW